MAGIGFELRRLSRQETISSIVGAAGHAAVIAAGPWLFTILSLAAISVLTERLVGVTTLADFRATIIYAFATSLVLTAPVTIVATRLVADALWLKDQGQVRPLLLAGFALALVSIVPGLALLVYVFGLAAPTAIALWAATAVVALIWVALSFCGAIRDYGAVTMSFMIGLAASVGGAILAAALGLGAPGMVWGFVAGLTITFFGLTQRVLRTFPGTVAGPMAGVAAIAAGLVRYRHLAIGALAGTAGVWVDKWLFWFSPEAEHVKSGLVHAPTYDSAMFIASLVIIPSLAAFVTKLETEFFDRYQHYYSTIRSHGTMRQIEDARERLAGYTLDNLVLITVAQVGLCAVLILTAPGIVETLNLQFQQIAILRYGALGVVFQFVFIAALSMLLFFDRRRLFLGLQVVFLVLNGGLTALSIALGPEYYGAGYFLACILASFLAFVLADRTFDNLNYLTFIGNNPSVRAGTAAVERLSWRQELHLWARGRLPRAAVRPPAPRS